MTSFCILRTKKLKTSGEIVLSARHTFREQPTRNADPNKTYLNHGIGPRTSKELSQRIDDEIKARCSRKPRTDSPKCIEVLMTASPKSLDNHSFASFLKQSEEWLKKTFGEENVIATDYQWDEKTPHLVGYVVPITKRGSLSSKEWLGGKQKLSELQNSFHSEVGQNFRLMRGKSGESPARNHIPPREFKKIFSEIENTFPGNASDEEKKDAYKVMKERIYKSECQAKINEYLEDEVSRNKSLVGLDQETKQLVDELVRTKEHPLIRQIERFDEVDSFDIGIREKSGRFQYLSNIDREGIRKYLSYLKYENANKETQANIYIKPHPKVRHPYILIDDLKIYQVDKLREEKGGVVAQIETSPLNYQVWVKADQNTNHQHRTIVAKHLCKHYGGDSGSAEGSHFGRAAGFTNRKEKYKTDEGYPYAKLVDNGIDSATVKPCKVTFINPIEVKDLIDTDTEEEKGAVFHRAKQDISRVQSKYKFENNLEFEKRALNMYKMYREGRVKSASEADYGAGMELIKNGYSLKKIREWLRLHTIDFKQRSHNDPNEYLKRTVRSINEGYMELLRQKEMEMSKPVEQVPKKEEPDRKTPEIDSGMSM